MSSVPQLKVLKIIIVGDSSVGKTCLTFRFCHGTFMNNPEATIGVDFHEKTIPIGSEEVKLQIWDTAGQERFRKSMVQHYYRNVHAVIIVYDITKIHTFNSVKHWVEECNAHGLGPHVPRILVGTQCDKVDQRVIRTSSAQRLADLHGMPLFETSSYLDSELETVNAIFMTLAHKLYNQRPFRVVTTEEVPEQSISFQIKNSYFVTRNKCC